MTALLEQLTGAAFSAPNILLPPLPATTGTTALWAYIGGSISQSQNLMPSSPAMVNVGAPTYQTAYGTFHASTPLAIDTGLKDDTRTFSLIWASRSGSALATPNASVPISNVDTGTNFGVNLNITTGGLQFALNGPAAPVPNRTLAVASVNTWKLYACAWDQTTNTMDIWDLTAGTNDHFVTGAGNRVLAATTNFWIGANPRATGNQPGDVAFAGLIKGQAITTALANQYAANIRANLAARGLTVP